MRIDLAGAISLMLAVVPMLLALSWGGRVYAWSSPIVMGCLASSAVMTLLFLRVEHRAAGRSFRPRFFTTQSLP